MFLPQLQALLDKIIRIFRAFLFEELPLPVFYLPLYYLLQLINGNGSSPQSIGE
jgi:hypothetical protein